MKNPAEPYPIEVFSGTAWEAALLKSMLEDNEIQAIMKDATVMPLNLLPLRSDSVKIFVSSDDYERAVEIVQDFYTNMQKETTEDE